MLGVSPDQLPPAASPDEEDFEVWPENWSTVRLFLACGTQWRASATMAGFVWVGLDYTAVEVVARGRRLPVDFEALQTMESAALAVLNGGAT